MSEHYSFFAKMTIKPEKFAEFLTAKPEQPILDSRWREWWDSLEMYGKIALTQSNLQAYYAESNQAVIATFQDDRSFSGFSDYDEATASWHFGIMLFSENYLEMIPGLAFIKSAAKYKENVSGDFAMIYDYLWGDGVVSAYIDFVGQEGVLSSTIQKTDAVVPHILQYSNDYLSTKLEEFQQSGEFD